MCASDEKDWTDPLVNPLIPMPGRDEPEVPPELDPSKNELIVTPPGYERPRAEAPKGPVDLAGLEKIDLGDGWSMVKSPVGGWWLYGPGGDADTHALADPRPGDMDRIQRALRK